MKHLLPLGIFAAIAIFLGLGLSLNPREVPSPFIGKPAPTLDLPRLYSQQQINNETFSGQVWILNVWASWCVACRAEHDLLVDFSRQFQTPIVGLNYKDADPDARKWLQDLGNPYAMIAVDQSGATGIEWGVYGVPETFVMDQQGIVRYKHIGPLDLASVQQKIIPLIRELESGS